MTVAGQRLTLEELDIDGRISHEGLLGILFSVLYGIGFRLHTIAQPKHKVVGHEIT
jgi:hypothetical protein